MATVNFAQPQDIAQLEALERSTYAHEGYPAPLFYQALMQWPQGLVVYRQQQANQQQAVGYLLAAPGQPHEQWIMSVLIAQSARGQGIGKQLLAFYLDQLSQQGVQCTVKLTVAPTNTPAIALYEQFGFEKVEYLPQCLGPGADRILMALQVS